MIGSCVGHACISIGIPESVRSAPIVPLEATPGAENIGFFCPFPAEKVRILGPWADAVKIAALRGYLNATAAVVNAAARCPVISTG